MDELADGSEERNTVHLLRTQEIDQFPHHAKIDVLHAGAA
jgi:hypothetical protein